jgi:hypothetical protein
MFPGLVNDFLDTQREGFAAFRPPASAISNLNLEISEWGVCRAYGVGWPRRESSLLEQGCGGSLRGYSSGSAFSRYHSRRFKGPGVFEGLATAA